MVNSCVDPNCVLYICIPANINTDNVADSRHDTPLGTAVKIQSITCLFQNTSQGFALNYLSVESVIDRRTYSIVRKGDRKNEHP